MSKGKLKIKCVSPHIKLGNVSFNSELIIDEIKKADKEGVSVLLLPELCLCGYSLRVGLSFPVIVDACKSELIRIANETKCTGVTVAVGTVIEIFAVPPPSFLFINM